MRVIVTGARRGLGLEACRLLKEQGHDVILTARKGAEEAAQELSVTGRQLDVTDAVSIMDFVEWLGDEPVGALINNAGIFLEEETDEHILESIKTNTIGPLRMARAIIPFMQNEGRIVNVSSGLGQLDEMGAGHTPYRVSKTALNAVTKILDAETPDTIRVNSVCPGWVKTDMGGASAPRDVTEGADTIVWAATEVEQSGRFFRDRKEIPW